MRKPLIFVFIVLFSTTVFQIGNAQASKSPVNPNATPEAKALLKYLYSIKGKNILSGQHNGQYPPTRSHDSIKSFTGKYPVVWGNDFSGRSRKLMIDEAKRQHAKGSIITLMYHMRRPFDSDTVRRSTWKKLTDAQWEELTTPGTAINKMWQDDIDSVAFYFKQLQEAKIPVLWRPYHEMNGVWFWWGNRPGENGFKKLWIMTYERFVNHHQLNNLIWVWNTNAPRDWENDQAYAYDLYYPGDQYVDVLAADIYKGDYKQSHHDDLDKLANGKLIALGEIGHVPPNEVLNQQPQWVWFMVWSGFPWTANNPQSMRTFYSDPKVLTLDEIKK
jgi:mannan endo-1,4-beta-mannosidase